MRIALDRATSSEGGTITLAGEAGIGKTMTAKELATVANEKGCEVLWGSSHEGPGAPAYWPWKQAMRALALLKPSHPDTRLVLAGSAFSDYLGRLKALAHSLKVEHQVEFPGYVPDPYRIYRSADAVLMCSPCEAFGRTTAEAMACAKPVIGYNAGGTPELIDPDTNNIKVYKVV